MSHIADMTPLGARRLAIGWLHPDHAFPVGSVSVEFSNRLTEFARRSPDARRAIRGGAWGGVHQCEFCGKAYGCEQFSVPDGDRIFYAPEMIAHYVKQHSYRPPDEFIKAVMDCPIPGTPEYQQRVEPFILR